MYSVQPQTGLKNIECDRKNSSGFLPVKEQLLTSEPICLPEFITPESWLIVDILKLKKHKVKWMLFPSENWMYDPDISEFQLLVKNIAVVNDAGERAVQAVQENVLQTYNDVKLQKMLLGRKDKAGLQPGRRAADT